MNRFSLNNKLVLITGGSGILGKKFVEGYLSVGARVAVIDKDVSPLTELYSGSEQELFLFEGNLTDEKQVTNLIDDISQKVGDINVLHNNLASKGESLDKFFAKFEDYSLDNWRLIMATNLDSVFLTCQKVGPLMIQNGGGSIISTASIYGVVAPDQRIYDGSEYMGRPINSPAVYTASKSALIGLTKYLASYWGHCNVRVNALTPGGVQSGQNDEFNQKYSQRVPLGRMAQADEMIGAAIFLASEDSKYITGQNIIVDGGLSCW